MLVDRGKPQPCRFVQEYQGRADNKLQVSSSTGVLPAGSKLTYIEACDNIHTANPYMSYLKAEWDDGTSWELTSPRKTDSYCKALTIPADRFAVGWTPYQGSYGYISGFYLRFNYGADWDSKKVTRIGGRRIE